MGCNEKNCSLCGWKGCNCCDGCCWTEGCNCRCGLSILFLGIFVLLAASAFYVVGWCFNIFGFDLNNANSWYHGFNVFWFELAGIIIVLGIFYELVTKTEILCGSKSIQSASDPANGVTTKDAVKAFLAPKNQADFDERRAKMIADAAAAAAAAAAKAKAVAAREPRFLTVESEDQVPTQYVMLPAEP